MRARNGGRWKKIIVEATTPKRKKKGGLYLRPMAAIMERKVGQSQGLHLERLQRHRKYAYFYALNGIRQHDASVGTGSRHYRLHTTQPQ